MTTVKIELQFDRPDVTKDDVYEYLNELMEDDSLDFYSISVYEDGRQKEFEWDHKEFQKNLKTGLDNADKCSTIGVSPARVGSFSSSSKGKENDFERSKEKRSCQWRF